MKKVLNILLVISMIGLIGIISCKKYPEGPAFSLRTKTARVANVWEVEKATYSIGSSTSDITESQFTNYKYSIEFTKDGKVSESKTVIVTVTNSGEWKFNDDKSKLMIKMDGDTEWDEWEILKLKESELWGKYVDGLGTTEIHLVTK